MVMMWSVPATLHGVMGLPKLRGSSETQDSVYHFFLFFGERGGGTVPNLKGRMLNISGINRWG
jgi:hypothetical protein